MSSSVSTTVGGVVVVTHVHPASQGSVPQHPVGIQKFTKGRPMALGSVQIMVGLMTLLFGIVMAIDANTLGVYSGFFVWGALFYIIAGSLTVAAGKSLNRCQVNGALGVNVVAAVAACTAVILYIMDAAGVLWIPCYDYDHGSWVYGCNEFQTRTRGFSGVLAVFHLLELIISITVAAYGCSATCNCSEQPPSFVVVPGDAAVAAQAPAFTQPPPVSQTVSYPKYPEEPRAITLSEPPAYTIS
ncbi:membrane-spanning 4-domains subfamily A member 4D [Lates calcarifer]|uniref:Membrane-spanning 4-domains subfamily A member 4D n=1 Tax=Lates calcarifer TaxID=8187 RepID=A0A4W6D3G9_LATCA|nr:membrane-spanning 4-domains subfamily A member 4D [Lates calcarifer]